MDPGALAVTTSSLFTRGLLFFFLFWGEGLHGKEGISLSYIHIPLLSKRHNPTDTKNLLVKAQ